MLLDAQAKFCKENNCQEKSKTEKKVEKLKTEKKEEKITFKNVETGEN
jgi:hypothetical protein